MQCLAVHARTSRYARRDGVNGCVRCPACGTDANGGESLHHLMFSCPTYSEARRALFEGVSSVPGCAARLQRVWDGPDCLDKVLDFVSDKWGNADAAGSVAEHIARYLEEVWSLRNHFKHSAASHSAERREADGINAMA